MQSTYLAHLEVAGLQDFGQEEDDLRWERWEDLGDGWEAIDLDLGDDPGDEVF